MNDGVVMTGRIDVHTHLLPGIDDGCKTIEQSIDCARVLVDNGYTHAFCTPHIWANDRGVSRTSVPRWCRILQEEYDRARVPLKLLPGGELNIFTGVTKLPPEEIVPLNLGRYQLVDMWASEIPPLFGEAVEWLKGMGLTMILAHPERMRAVQDRPEVIDEIMAMGVLLQGNLQCFADPPEAFTRICAERFLSEGKYWLLGSDTHGPDGVGVRMKGLNRVFELVGEKGVDLLTKENPAKLIDQVAA